MTKRKGDTVKAISTAEFKRRKASANIIDRAYASLPKIGSIVRIAYISKETERTRVERTAEILSKLQDYFLVEIKPDEANKGRYKTSFRYADIAMGLVEVSG